MELLGTTDVWWSAFLVSEGYKVVKFDVLPKHHVKFYFEINNDDWKKLKLKFNDSELVKFKMIIDQLKDLSY